MYAKRRKIHDLSGSMAIFLPPGTPHAKEASMVGDRLVWIDPSGRLSLEELLDIVEELEPKIWARLERTKSRGSKATP